MKEVVTRKSCQWRVGLDLGVNSLGWCCLRLNTKGEPSGILDIGVRLLTPDTIAAGRNSKGPSLAADRRIARQMRRRRDRYLRRRKRFMNALIGLGLMPANATARKALEALDPYELRARALDERLEPYKFGRALFHLSQRRGFKSSRKNISDDKESSLIEDGINRLRAALQKENCRTVGEYFWVRQRKLDQHGHASRMEEFFPGMGGDPIAGGQAAAEETAPLCR